MDIKFERAEDNTGRLTVTVPAEKVDVAVAEAYKRVASKIRVPGFRAGKAPRPIVDGQVGREAVLEEAREIVINDSFPAALDAEDLRPVGQPDLGELDMPEEGQPFTFVAEIEMRPEFTLADASPFTIEVPPSTATEREIDAQIQTMREKFATVEPVEDRGAVADDFVLLSFHGKVDGEEYEGNRVDKYLYEMGRGLMPEGFDLAVVGAKPGDEVTAEFVIPETSSNPDFVGKAAVFDVTVHEVKAKRFPELDAEFAASVGGFDSMDQLKEDIRRRIDQSKALTHAHTVEREARRALAAKTEGETPQALVDQARDSMIRDFFNNLESRGITLKDYVNAADVDPEQIERDIAEQAERSVREELALEALFRARGLEITDADVDEALREMAGDRPVDELREQWRDAGVMPVLREQVMHRKAVRWLMDNVEVVEKEPAVDGNDESPAQGDKSAAKKTPSTKKSTRKKTEPAEAPAEQGSEE